MSDINGVPEPYGPWTIKSIATRIREAVIVAARKEGLTVGDWLEKRIEEWLEDGSPVRVSPSQPGLALVTTGDDRVRELAELVRLAGVLSAQETDTPLLKEARGAVRARLRSFRPTR
jgi:hypothetical protein